MDCIYHYNSLFQVNPHTHQVKLCDFGSAKVLVFPSPSVSYFKVEHFVGDRTIYKAWVIHLIHKLPYTFLNELLSLCSCSSVHAHADETKSLESLPHFLLHAWKALRYVWFLVLLWTSFIIHHRWKANQIYHTFVHVIIEHLNSYLGQLNTLLPLTSGLWVACLLNCFLDRFSMQYKKFHLIYLGFIRGVSKMLFLSLPSVLAFVASLPRWEWSWSACWDY